MSAQSGPHESDLQRLVCGTITVQSMSPSVDAGTRRFFAVRDESLGALLD